MDADPVEMARDLLDFQGFRRDCNGFFEILEDSLERSCGVIGILWDFQRFLGIFRDFNGFSRIFLGFPAILRDVEGFFREF